MKDKINGRTPEEIKNGLDCCINWGTGCTECPYDNLPPDECVAVMKSDNLEYIQQLERERDVLMESLMDSGYLCSTCAHDGCDVEDEPCKSCEPINGRLASNWQWRGVPEEVE